MGPSSGASVALLWAVTFVPEWNFDSFLVLFFFFILCCYSFFLWSVSSLHLCRCLFLIFTPVLSNQVRLTTVKVIFGLDGRWGDFSGRLSGKQKSREMIAPSGHFSSIHQLPGPTPKIEKEKKPFIVLVFAEPHWQALSMCNRWKRDCAKVFLHVQGSLYCQGASTQKSFSQDSLQLKQTLKKRLTFGLFCRVRLIPLSWRNRVVKRLGWPEDKREGSSIHWRRKWKLKREAS